LIQIIVVLNQIASLSLELVRPAIPIKSTAMEFALIAVTQTHFEYQTPINAVNLPQGLLLIIYALLVIVNV